MLDIPGALLHHFPFERSFEVTLWRYRVAERFLPITFDGNELETLGWCHSVRLVKAHLVKAKVAQTPGHARVIIEYTRISGSQNRHTDMKEPTEDLEWRRGMKRADQRDRLPRIDGAGASDCGRAAAHPPSTPPPNRLWYLPYLGIRSPLTAATASMSGCPATANIFNGTAWSLLQIGEGYTRSFKCA